jgi:hypothetical protein
MEFRFGKSVEEGHGRGKGHRDLEGDVGAAGAWVCAAHPILFQPPYQSIHLSYACCEVQCEREKWKGGIISALLFMANTFWLSSTTIRSPQTPNPTPEKKNSRMAIRPFPASQRRYRMNNQCGLHLHLMPG